MSASLKEKPDQSCSVVVTDLSHDGRGVVKLAERVYFVPGALPGETIRFLPLRKRKGQFAGKLLEVIEPSVHRVTPRCRYFGVCGGCTLQHLAPDQQLVLKQKTLFNSLRRIGGVEPEQRLSPLAGDSWGYRRKARPGVKLVPKKGGVLVGFREQGSSYLTSLRDCHTLEPALAVLLDPLHSLIENLSIPNQIPQIEMAAGDRSTALILRHLQPLTAPDLSRLTKFAQQNDLHLYLQSGGPETIEPLYPAAPKQLDFDLPNYQITLQFTPSDFVQVNGIVNQKTIDQALDWLRPIPDDTVLDLFCGLGNFTLPVARSGASVLGIEGDVSLVQRARANATHNGLENARFDAADLQRDGLAVLGKRSFNKLLLDPPRSGALHVVTELVPALTPDVIVYVSCNPSTLARDAAVLTSQHGYLFRAAGAIDMFPHTAHVESMAVFTLP